MSCDCGYGEDQHSLADHHEACHIMGIPHKNEWFKVVSSGDKDK